MNAPFLKLDGITKRFAPKLSLGDKIAMKLGVSVETRAVHAVENVSLELKRGETLGLVGESGCGKSTLGRVAAGILAATQGEVKLEDGDVMEDGKKITTRVQTVFQDPFASLNPRMRVGDIVAEGPLAHGLIAKDQATAYVRDWLERVGLDGEFADRYPHQFSGGQRQRIAIARALAMQPDLLVCDEPVASLDVSIQAQIINLFLKLQKDLELTCIFISHDLGVVRHVSDRVAVMYLGRIVEIGETEKLYSTPSHPYTQALLNSVPKLVLDSDELVEFNLIEGEIPSPLEPPTGCGFNPRCPHVMERCRSIRPDLLQVSKNHQVSCHLFADSSIKGKDKEHASE